MYIMDIWATPKRCVDFWKYIEEDNIMAAGVSGTYKFDSISSYVWERIDGETTISQIVKDILSIYQLVEKDDFSIVASDVINLLAKWKEISLVIVNHNPLHPFAEHNPDADYSLHDGIKEKSDLLLMVPPSTLYVSSMHHTQNIYPLGMGYLASYLHKYSPHTVSIKNLWQTNCNDKSLENLFLHARPILLGLSCMTDNYLNGIRIAHIAKRVLPDIKIVMGGPHPTFRADEIINTQSCIDYVIRSEGENALLELSNSIITNSPSVESILGLTYRIDGEVHHNDRRPFNTNLDALPFPERGSIDIDADTTISIHTSRGCPGRCIFCCAASMSGNRYRTRSADNIIDEMESLYKKGARKFIFTDDTFTVDIPRLWEFITKVQSKGWKDIYFTAESRVDVVNRDIAVFKALREIGCQGIQFGVEAGSQRMLNLLRKGIKIEWVTDAVKAVVDAGLSTTCTLLIGHPYDTEETIRETVEFSKVLIDLGADVFLACVVPYPGSDICENAKNYKVTIDPVSYDQYLTSNAIMTTPFLTKKKIRNLFFDSTNELLLYKKKSPTV